MTKINETRNETVLEPELPGKVSEKIIRMKIIFNNGKSKRYTLPKNNFDVEDGFIMIMKTETKGVAYPLSRIKKVKIKDI